MNSFLLLALATATPLTVVVETRGHGTVTCVATGNQQWTASVAPGVTLHVTYPASRVGPYDGDAMHVRLSGRAFNFQSQVPRALTERPIPNTGWHWPAYRVPGLGNPGGLWVSGSGIAHRVRLY